jgi:4-hydroxybenzoate polyprenyltransferase
VARGCHAGTVALLVVLAHAAGLGWLYLASVAVVALLLLVENSLVRAGDYSNVNLAFFTINGIVSVLMGVLAVADILLGFRRVF